jgi:hypothetical protein
MLLIERRERSQSSLLIVLFLICSSIHTKAGCLVLARELKIPSSSWTHTYPITNVARFMLVAIRASRTLNYTTSGFLACFWIAYVTVTDPGGLPVSLERVNPDSALPYCPLRTVCILQEQSFTISIPAVVIDISVSDIFRWNFSVDTAQTGGILIVFVVARKRQ